MKIAFLDQDGHTVKLAKEEIAACLKEMGNPKGNYLLIPIGHREEATNILIGSLVKAGHKRPDVALQIRARTRHNYSWFTLWRKKRMGSKLLDHEIPSMVEGRPVMVKVQAKPVWLRLKKNEVVTIEVE